MSNQESNYIKEIFDEINQLINNSNKLEPVITNCINIIEECLKKGGKIILFGNGGSAADAQHIAAELLLPLEMTILLIKYLLDNVKV